MAHLNIYERTKIELMLKSRSSITSIAAELGKACSTISREILKHSVESRKLNYNRIQNLCIHRRNCNKSYLCNKRLSLCRKKSCSLCEYCNEVCPDFVEEKCLKLSGVPHVCNGCIDERKCTLVKRFYIPKIAHKEYETLLKEARSGVNLSEEEYLHLDDFFSPLLLNGQSISHICAKNPNEMICSTKSIYRYVSGGLFKAKNIDLPRVVRMKPRKTKPVVHKIDNKCYINRTHDVYLKYLSENPGIQVVEMDSVEGVKGGKVLLTLHFKGLCDFMLAFIRDHNTAQSVIEIFDHLYYTLKPDLFRKLFKVINTDRGTEFTNPTALEIAPDGSERCRIFFCDPQASWQKPNVELNHEFIRRILPKGTSFDNLDQNDIDLMMNHINSYGREKINYRSPAEALSSLFGQKVLELLNVKIIPANEIILHPRLLRK